MSEWQPIETAPKDDQRRAIWISTTRNGWMEPVWWHWVSARGGRWWRNAYTYDVITWEPTHWQPLPDPPESTTP